MIEIIMINTIILTCYGIFMCFYHDVIDITVLWLKCRFSVQMREDYNMACGY